MIASRQDKNIIIKLIENDKFKKKLENRTQKKMCLGFKPKTHQHTTT